LYEAHIGTLRTHLVEIRHAKVGGIKTAVSGVGYIMIFRIVQNRFFQLTKRNSSKKSFVGNTEE